MIDLHCHLDLYPDPHEAVRRCVDANAYVLSVTTTPKAWRGTLALAAGHLRIRTALGLHPQLAHQRHGELPLFEALLPEARYVGEIGLDGSPEYKPHQAVQVRCFERILRTLEGAGGRIMTIHSRGAADEVLDALERHPNAGAAVLHWFSGNKRQLDRAVAMGCWFSVGPPMLRSRKGTELVAAMPPERVLTETDGPFGQDGGRSLMPAEVESAIEGCGRLWSIPTDVAAAKLRGSLSDLLKAMPAPTSRITEEALDTWY